MEFFNVLNNGKAFCIDEEVNVNDLKWNKTASEGVYIKHLVEGRLTDNKLSCHLVKIGAGCEISTHIHEGKLELHEILDGEGIGFLENKNIKYIPGVSVVILPDIQHRVIAGEKDLYLLAKFTPALI